MTRINLLPWREEQKEERQKEFFIILLITAVLALVCVYFYSSYIDSTIETQQKRNSFLQQKINVLDVKIKGLKDLESKRLQVVQRLTALELLQANRSNIVKRFNALPSLVPQGVYLTKLVQKGETVGFEGVSENNKQVSLLMQALDKTLMFSKLTLHFVKSSEGKNANKGISNTAQKTFNIEAVIANKNLLDKTKIKSGGIK